MGYYIDTPNGPEYREGYAPGMGQFGDPGVHTTGNGLGGFFSGWGQMIKENPQLLLGLVPALGEELSGILAASGAAVAPAAAASATTATGASLTPMAGVSFLPGAGAAAAPLASTVIPASTIAPTAAAGGGMWGAAGPVAGVTQIGSSIANGVLGNKQANENRQLQAAQLAEQKRQFDLQQSQRQGENAANATQLDPFTQQKSRQRQALAATLLGGYSPVKYGEGHLTGGLAGITPDMLKQGAMPFYGPEAMQSAENQFTSNIKKSAPNYQGPSQGVGYGPATNNKSKLADLLASMGGL